jgi:hypothetical protein
MSDKRDGWALRAWEEGGFGAVLDVMGAPDEPIPPPGYVKATSIEALVRALAECHEEIAGLERELQRCQEGHFA